MKIWQQTMIWQQVHTRSVMNRCRGVTLIEMLIAMSVVSCVLLAVVNVMTSSQRLFNSQVGNAKSLLGANRAMDAMCAEIGNAVSSANDSNGNPSIFIMPLGTDSSGNYVPNASGAYDPGTAVQFYLSDGTGKTNNGHTKAGVGIDLWRTTGVTTTSGGLLGGLLGGGGTTTTWTTDTKWGYEPGGTIMKYQNISALTFTTTGMPANTVQVSLTVYDKEGGQTSPYTLTRDVYLSNHN